MQDHWRDTAPRAVPGKVPEFFIKLLTEPGDVVLDIFAGSNTTGQVAESAKRRWLAFERSREYVGASALRFLNPQESRAEMRKVFERIEAGKTIDLNPNSAKGRSAGQQRRGGNGVSSGTYWHHIAVLILAERDKLDRAIGALEGTSRPPILRFSLKRPHDAGTAYLYIQSATCADRKRGALGPPACAV